MSKLLDVYPSLDFSFENYASIILIKKYSWFQFPQLCFECEMSSIGLRFRKLGSPLVALFWKIVEPLGGGSLTGVSKSLLHGPWGFLWRFLFTLLADCRWNVMTTMPSSVWWRISSWNCKPKPTFSSLNCFLSVTWSQKQEKQCVYPGINPLQIVQPILC